MDTQALKSHLLKVVEDCILKGPGWAQESVVLRETAEQLRLKGDLRKEQELLTCWHDLFKEGHLSWGYNLENPSSPFFHRRLT